MIRGTKNFYDEISGFYGKMIDFDKNLELRIAAYKNIFQVPGKVADIGCGIGLDSIALAKNGHDVTAFDVSPKMIEEAKSNAEKLNLQIDAHVHSFNSLPNVYHGNFHYAVSVGNTIAHLSHSGLRQAFKKMYNLLLPSGKVFLHILNYELIIKESKRINNIAVRDGQVIIRFYDLHKRKINFNILSFAVERPREFKIASTVHYPHTKNKIEEFLRASGFSRIRFSKNFNREKFLAKDSKDIFIEAFKK
jgi:SAM-dependent methyltransferase